VRRSVDRAGDERGVDVPGEQALAAGLGERPVWILSPLVRMT
jgi:hypothetical protein